jgi:hypothetical protein
MRRPLAGAACVLAVRAARDPTAAGAGESLGAVSAATVVPVGDPVGASFDPAASLPAGPLFAGAPDCAGSFEVAVVAGAASPGGVATATCGRGVCGRGSRPLVANANTIAAMPAAASM